MVKGNCTGFEFLLQTFNLQLKTAYILIKLLQTDIRGVLMPFCTTAKIIKFTAQDLKILLLLMIYVHVPEDVCLLQGKG